MASSRPEPGARDDVRLDGLTGLRVRDADHRDLVDVGVADDRVLDLARVDVEAVDDHELLATVDEHEVAVVVEVGHVAGGEPAVGVGPPSPSGQ